MADIDTDLPKAAVKPKLKVGGNSAATEKPKKDKAAKPAAKTNGKANGKAKPEKAAAAPKANGKKVEAKGGKSKAETKKASAPAGKKANAPAKGGKTAAPKAKAEAKKPAATSKAPAAKGGAVATADVYAASILKAVNSGKAEAPKSVAYDNVKDVSAALVAKAASVLIKAYSDKNLLTVSHADAAVAKAVKASIADRLTKIRSTAVEGHAKKFGGAIAKAAKTASTGKLTATEFKAVAFAI